ncbi:hypothetical protein L6R52_04445 [Myxococcota bacterium]|nr:hypothetical protein [Myxococcota bacterium]
MEKKKTLSTSTEAETKTRTRRPYQSPRLTKKRSVARVTLFSGGGATAGGLTAAG